MKELLSQLLSGDRPKVLLTRMFIAIVLVFVFIVWTSHKQIIQGIFDSRVDTVYQEIKQKRQEKYNTVVKEQVQSAYALINPDSVMVLEYRPININEYLDIVAFEGELPNRMSSNDLYGMAVSKVTPEYQSHVLGSPYSEEGSNGIVHTSRQMQAAYRYSCPVFNLNNIYSGMVVYMWYDSLPYTESGKADFKRRIMIYCNQNARTIGRAK
ncbi:MAG: hypothetical protein CL489_08735 [Acidobacteria bacterium]|nr:hypothetical protein [Acidobacteriota bacterium]|tara:strand:+ start:24523 stop:25155 length:633 start_codon:yes stop_codon:yes gene_type:complete